MKDKEPTSVKAIRQAARPYPTTPHPTSQSSKSGPKYFPPEVLPEDDMENDMDLIPYMPGPPSPTSPPSPHSPPNTPTPGGHTNHVQPLRPDPLVYQEFNVKVHTPSVNKTPETGLASSIHAPGNTMGDQLMNDPPNPTTAHTPTPEEQAILAHLALAEMNRSVLSHNGTSQSTTLPQFTPVPNGGFPLVHMLHSAQIFDHLDNRVLLAWFQVKHPKFLVQVFDHSGKDVAERAAIIAERIRTTITTIAESIHHTTPPIRISLPQPQGGNGAKGLPIGFLVHKVTNETKDLILHQHIWSTTDLTFEALPFNCVHPPELLFGLTGFTMLDVATVLQAVIETWSQEEHRDCIDNLFSNCSLPDDEMIYKATHDFVSSCHIELLDFKIAGGLSVPRFNILATSPTNDAQTWMDLRLYLSSLTYPTNLDGCGNVTALFACQICHSLAHPCGLCPFSLIPHWNGPKVGNRTSNNTSRPNGRGRENRPNCNAGHDMS